MNLCYENIMTFIRITNFLRRFLDNSQNNNNENYYSRVILVLFC